MKNYPSRIIPDENYKLITDGLSGAFIIRSTKTKDDLVNDCNEVKVEHICSPSDHIQDLSTSLLGVFEPIHSYIELTEEGKKKYADGYCLPDCKVELPIYEQHYEWNELKGYWFVPIDRINGLTVEYLTSNPPLKAKCVVLHTPAKWNYWHFSIRWLFEDGRFWNDLSDDEKKKERLKRKFAHEVRSAIAKFADIMEPSYSELDCQFYMK